jgi:putative tryptophan/tyrosine transport system substrate-binding protein
VKRRAFIAVLGGATAWPLAGRAQQPERMRRVGVLGPRGADDLEAEARIAAFVKELQQLGWTEAGNVRIDIRRSAGNPDATRSYVAELVELSPDVIFAIGNATVAPLLQATRTIPIVFATVPDPVGAGFVDSLAWGAARIIETPG